jgi:serine/threonine-protein phosphatase CPPED1
MQFRTLFFLLFSVHSLHAMAQQAPTPPVFFQVADPQLGMFSNNNGSQQEIDNLTSILKSANLLHPAFVVICDDLTNNSLNKDGLVVKEEQIQNFKSTIALLAGVPLYLVPGNHDVGTHPTALTLASYRERFGPDYYEFHAGSLIGIVLDSMIGPRIHD